MLLSFLFLFMYQLISKYMPDLFPLLASGDREAIEDMLKDKTGVYAALLTIAMEFLQTITVVIPGTPINIAAGLVFGGFLGTLICSIGFVAANVTVFFVAKKLQGLVERVIPSNSEKSKRWKFISNSETPVLMIILAYAIPGVPNGFIPYISAKSSISVKMYAFAVLCGSLPGIIFSNFIGHFLLDRNYWAVCLLSVIWLICFVLMVVNKNTIYKIVKRFLT